MFIAINKHSMKYSKDDGGSAKGSARRNRRQLKKVINVGALVLGIIGIFYLLIAVQHNVKDRIAMKRSRNKIALRKHMQRFTAHTDDNDGRKNADKNAHSHAHNNAIEEPDSFEGHEEEKYNDCTSKRPKYRWIDLRQLPPLDNDPKWFKKYLREDNDHRREDYKIDYNEKELCWEKEAEKVGNKPPKVDYTKIKYKYPEPIFEPPRGGAYPDFETMEQMFKKWPQEDIDHPPTPFVEKLQHFDFNNPKEMEAAVKYRDLEFPFKIYNIPEIDAANKKWTDEYLSFHFDRFSSSIRHKYSMKEAKNKFGHMPPSSGKAQYSVDSFFAFFTTKHWNVGTMGPPPTKDTDLTFEKWAKHARYADAVGLANNKHHYYWQSGVPASERKRSRDEWTMISNDLPSFSSPEANFFSFNPKEQKGIQCRFGERGVTAATHYDGGRNMVGMITGAKRYILSPPKECSKLGVVTKRKHPVYRHSLLNFGHISQLEQTDDFVAKMPNLEREWLDISKTALAIDTVLKAGEVLYIPSHWFHYIVSLQKSAQCNVRAGRHMDGSPEWGGSDEVEYCEND